MDRHEQLIMNALEGETFEQKSISFLKMRALATIADQTPRIRAALLQMEVVERLSAIVEKMEWCVEKQALSQKLTEAREKLSELC